MTGTVVFDLDGTLADTAADLVAAANGCFSSRGLGALLDPVADAGIAFHGGRAMLRAGYARMPEGMILPHDAEDVDFRRLLDFYEADIARHTTLYDGVDDALAELQGMGLILSICTNKPGALAEKLLAALEAKARQRDCHTLRLETGIHQHAAIALYTRNGYQTRCAFAPYQPDPLSVFMAVSYTHLRAHET